jgi:hypothetical protein
LEDVGVDERIILKLMLNKYGGRDRNQWRAFVITAMNLRVPYKPF